MPKQRLNLTLDGTAIERAKRYSEAHDVSISRLVNGFLSRLPGADADASKSELTPAVRRLVGIGEGELDEEAYHEHLIQKYG